jgi:hypothetical protein
MGIWQKGNSVLWELAEKILGKCALGETYEMGFGET